MYTLRPSQQVSIKENAQGSSQSKLWIYEIIVDHTSMLANYDNGAQSAIQSGWESSIFNRNDANMIQRTRMAS